MKVKVWISAFRLRTLPLSLSSIGMGSILAWFYGSFSGSVFTLALLTTVFLQVLSNLANDYGDYQHGADNTSRVGPARAVQSGSISPGAMKKGIFVFALLSLVSGISLLLVSLSLSISFLIMLMIGLLAIAAAIKYTAGKKPYGYAGLGDISVFCFFGIAGVLGTFFLHSGYVTWLILLPAASCGLFAVGVLNLNNMRDAESDEPVGKKTIPVRLGPEKSVAYHVTLISLGVILSIVFVGMVGYSYWQWLFVLATPLFIKNILAAVKYKKGGKLDPYLRQLAISTFFFVLIFSAGFLFAG
ncbi:1,4-dihydroxy-2-naphthoate polyprenyltransferase [Cytophagaceae bacterium ABcell3]|nr:1,4-dihydroxy-2-naphthoate polyprenyltransferase [Cytophagaceae bacterium ABcell3]